MEGRSGPAFSRSHPLMLQRSDPVWTNGEEAGVARGHERLILCFVNSVLFDIAFLFSIFYRKFVVVETKINLFNVKTVFIMTAQQEEANVDD